MPEVDVRPDDQPECPPGYELLTNDDGTWFARLGPHHEPFRIRAEVSGRVLVQASTRVSLSPDPVDMLSPFIATDDRERLVAALDDEERPITLEGAVAIYNRLVRKVGGRPFTRR